MRQRYPFLAHWKEIGLDRFPEFVLDIIPQRVTAFYELEVRSQFRSMIKEDEVSRHQFEHLQMKSPQEAQQIEDDFVHKLLHRIAQVKLEKWNTEYLDRVDQEKNRIIDEVLGANKRLMGGDQREKVCRDMSNALLPSTKGGPSMLSKHKRVVLKMTYLELQNCIKEVRRRLDMPVNKPDDYHSFASEDIKELIPEIDHIFDEEEFSVLAKGTPSDVALELILNRLSSAGELAIVITPRTLRDILGKTHLPNFLVV